MDVCLCVLVLARWDNEANMQRGNTWAFQARTTPPTTAPASWKHKEK